jgi:uncharacterized membrane protein YeaQ/YmgE (transglycosylase-associated protein family)
MGLVFLIVVGGMLGWLAAIISGAERSAAKARNVLIGVAGALVAGLVVNPLVGAGDLLSGEYDVDGLLIGLVGAALVLLAANLWRDGELR